MMSGTPACHQCIQLLFIIKNVVKKLQKKNCKYTVPELTTNVRDCNVHKINIR